MALGAVQPWWEQQPVQEPRPGAQQGSAGEEPREGTGAKEGAKEGTEEGRGIVPYPMDYYAKDGGVWNSSYHKR